jgi:hypothetical protein
MSRLEIALNKLLDVTPEQFQSWTREAQLAFLINAHNAHAMWRIARLYPVRSIGATGGFLSTARGERNIRLLGGHWSLKDLQSEIMSYPYHEPRAIFLLNWGARGCVPLPSRAVTTLSLDDLLESQPRAALAVANYCRYDAPKFRVYLSPLIKWYRPEFERQYASLNFFLTKYLPEQEVKQLQHRPPVIRWLGFDRHLNDVTAAKTQ